MSDVAAAQAEIERWLVRYQQAPGSKAFAPLADAYRAAGRPQDAVRVLEAGLGRYPEYVSGLVLLGLCWRELHEDDRAETVFARVLELDPDNLVALRHRAECARRRGVPERAAEYLRRALTIDPFDRDVQADLGLVTAALERQAREPADAAGRAAGARGPVPPVVAAPPGPASVIAYPAAASAAEWLPPPPAAGAPEWTPPQAVPPAAAPLPGAAARLGPEPSAPVSPEAAPPETPSGAGVEVRRRAALEPPTIDLRRVGRAEPEGARPAEPEPAPGPAPAAPSEPVPGPAPGPAWRYTRDADRIVVAPADTPVRGPIRSVEERLFGEHRPVPLPPVVPLAPEPAAAAPAAAEPLRPPGAPSGEFATMTLARIYESQGYLQKAAAIYETLQRQRPDDAEIAQRLLALRRKQAGAPEGARPGATAAPAVRPVFPPAASAPEKSAAAAVGPAAAPARPATAPFPSPRPAGPAAAPNVAPRVEEERGVAWRLLDPAALSDPTATAGRLRQATQAARDQEQSRRHTVLGAPPAAPLREPEAAPPAADADRNPPREDLSRGHEDYQRFLSYLRTLRP